MNAFKCLVFSISLVAITATAFAQEPPDPRIFEQEEIVWCGLDFSEARFVGSEGFTNPHDIVTNYFHKWNYLMISESEKYNFREAYDKEVRIDDLSAANRRNETVDHTSLVINEAFTFQNEGVVESIVKDYDLKKKTEGLGLVYVVESFNKLDATGTMYLVFFDIATKEILWKKKYASRAGGFGLRNFWARSVYETIEESRDDYKKARKKNK